MSAPHPLHQWGGVEGASLAGFAAPVISPETTSVCHSTSNSQDQEVKEASIAGTATAVAHLADLVAPEVGAEEYWVLEGTQDTQVT